ncbi:MAG: tetratricopeptide repeat protein, partial [Flavobacteriales bacterium]|nr:tetratricopeptide repeat protein [Flavobacteriales bacterium]
MRPFMKIGSGEMLFVAIALLVFPFLGANAEEKADSLETLLSTNIPDSTRVNILNNLCRYYTPRNRGKAMSFGNDALTLALSTNIPGQIARAKNLIGIIQEGDGDYEGALRMYLESLRIYEQIKDTVGIGHLLSNLGVVYYYMDNYETSERYFLKGLRLREKQGNKLDIAGSINNLGVIYYEQEKYNVALDYYDRSLQIRQELGNKEDISASLNNIGSVYEAMGKYNLAIGYYNQSVILDEDIGNGIGAARSYFNIAEVYITQGNYVEALTYLEKSRVLADMANAQDLLHSLYEDLSKVYDGMSNHKKALDYYKKYAVLKDSLFNADKSKEIGKLEAKYEFEKEEVEKKSLEQQERARLKDIESRRDNLQYSGILIFLVIMGGSLLTFRQLPVPMWLA